ncbi:MAG: M28 family peptidase [Flavobacteriaceae bacterium]
MRVFLFLISLFLFAACGTTTSTVESEKQISNKRPDGLKAAMETGGYDLKEEQSENEVSASPTEVFTDSLRLREILTFLASDELEGRDSGSKGIETAANYIENSFEKNGLERFFSTYRDTLLNYKLPSYNIIGLVPGKDEMLADEYILVGAHYDHVGIIGKGATDSIANGANDNASGTATVLELARYFGIQKNNKRSLLFVLFSAEEKGLLGSTHLSERLKQQGINIVAMLNFEMTGVPMVQSDFLLYLTGYQRSNLADLCNEYSGENLIGFLPQAKEYQLFQRSDNYPFHQAFGVPSQTFCTFDFTNYDYYHKVGDEVFRLDFNHMARVVNKMIPVIEGLSNTLEQEIKYY